MLNTYLTLNQSLTFKGEIICWPVCMQTEYSLSESSSKRLILFYVLGRNILVNAGVKEGSNPTTQA